MSGVADIVQVFYPEVMRRDVMRTTLQEVGAAVQPTAGLLDAARNLLKQAESKVGVQSVPVAEELSARGSDGNSRISFAQLAQQFTAPGESGKIIQLTGSRTLMMAWAGQICGEQGWCGVVGMPDFGWAAAAHLGIPLHRSLVVPQPHALDVQVISTLLEGCDVVLIACEIPTQFQRRLAAKARAYRCHLLTENSWQQPHHRFEVVSGTYPDSSESLGMIELALAGVQGKHYFQVGRKGVFAVTAAKSRVSPPKRTKIKNRIGSRQVRYA